MAETTADEREEFARYFAWAYGGEEYAESGSSREHWLEIADDFLARPFMRAYVEARVQAADKSGYERGKRETAEFLSRVAQEARRSAVRFRSKEVGNA